MVKNRGAVMGPPVHELTIGIGGIDLLPKDFHQLGVSDFRWVKSDLDPFRVSLVPIIFVGGVGVRAVGITRGYFQNPFQLLKGRRHAPETSSREGGGIDFGLGGVNDKKKGD